MGDRFEEKIMLDFINKSINGAVDLVVDTPLEMMGVGSDARSTIKNAVGLGLTIYEISEITGIAVDTLNDIINED